MGDDRILLLHGGVGSPYTMKMRAYLRYRRIPFRYCQIAEWEGGVLARVRPAVIPVLEWSDGRVANDSTSLIEILEQEHPGRETRPPGAVFGFLSAFLEDFADEWATKWMFDYRWARHRDQEACSRWLSFDRLRSAGSEKLEAFAAEFRARQVQRMPLVGCTDGNRPAIEESFLTAIRTLNEQVRDCQPFLFGSRPSAADFAIFGQLSQLASDPTPGELRWRRKFGQVAKVGSTSLKDGLYDWEAEAVLG